ncbi:hypothetical protein AALP_AA7G021700 [Arabis alpina]|uniref:Uncharacterized protein n=1 Tax=Arabis alpina TaxID=50452 RepID=A0A087GFG3_ARAAL|nr:hypothetical protein AALP_AA7G021700 [Arabis alpina]
MQFEVKMEDQNAVFLQVKQTTLQEIMEFNNLTMANFQEALPNSNYTVRQMRYIVNMLREIKNGLTYPQAIWNQQQQPPVAPAQAPAPDHP